MGNIAAAPSAKRPVGVMRAIARALEEVSTPTPGSLVIQWLAGQSGAPSIALKILAFATGGTANCAGGHSCARLYLALQGMAIPVGDTTPGMDLERREWWLLAMAEHATGRWRGNAQGVKAIAAAQPLIWEQAQAATKAWEKTE
ncbi:hypothetical protein [Mesorhizobium sp. YM1C-6-2]|uniref:hypothetical protein n=1 Tax=Mesorhizobium sp. YM1C-6-2 TaxID=1827501 RepID=UPI0011C4865C|nr:hypothetical protein [Mesorhizobium sp. YM1C-6-2]